MSIVQAIILGAVQGFTEFLPISSSGHLVIAQSLLGVRLPGITFEVMVHVGTLLAVFAFYWGDIWRVLGALFAEVFGLGKKPRGVWKNPDSRLAIIIALASIPAGIAGVLLKERAEELFARPLLVGAALLVTGVVLWSSEGDRRGKRKEGDLKVRDALAVGIAQAIAIAPGLSRSGLTISAALRRKIDRPIAARLSFLMSMPVIGGAALLDLYGVAKNRVPVPWAPVVAGTFAAFVTGLFAIRFIVSVIKAGRFKYFAVYCWVIGAITLIVSLLGKAA